jgi:ABC-2 type transport system ATP-binding protein
MNDLVINIKGLTKSFGTKVVVNNLSMSIKRGEIIGFLGPNGSGKTTTIRMLCGLLQPDAGEGTCLGYDIRTPNPNIKHKIGYMTQKFSYYDDLTIRENLIFVAKAYGLTPTSDIVNHTLENLGLTDRQHQLAGYLSGGWKQRLALAAAIMHNPDLLLLDEPTAGVDPKARREFWDQIHQLAKDGLTVLVSTHYMDEAERCHRIAYILYGNLVTEGSIESVIQNAGLTTWAIHGNDLGHLAPTIKGLPGVDQVTFFGNTLHVTGKDTQLLLSSINALQENRPLKIELTNTGLEDVFIHYMEPPNTMRHP